MFWEIPVVPGGHVAQILCFQNHQPADAPVLGGKNASLGTLLSAGLPVPPGVGGSASVAAAGAQAPALIGSLAVTAGLADAIRSAYAQLCSGYGDDAARVTISMDSIPSAA